jgi:hypothetical protein
MISLSQNLRVILNLFESGVDLEMLEIAHKDRYLSGGYSLHINKSLKALLYHKLLQVFVLNLFVFLN